MTQEELNIRHQQVQEFKRNLSKSIAEYMEKKQARIDAYKAEQLAEERRQRLAAEGISEFSDIK